MRRRRYLHGSLGVATVAMTGCLGLFDSEEPTREDLSQYDERGLVRYEEAHDRGTDVLDEFEEALRPDIERLDDDERSGSAAFAFHDTVVSVHDEFEAVSERYMEALYLSETPAFNRPSYDGAQWARAYAEVCDALFVSNVNLRGLATARQRLARASGLAVPVDPDTLLERVLEHY